MEWETRYDGEREGKIQENSEKNGRNFEKIESLTTKKRQKKTRLFVILKEMLRGNQKKLMKRLMFLEQVFKVFVEADHNCTCW